VIDAGDLRNGSVFERDGQLYVCVGYSHMKMGRGTAQVRARLRNLKTGAIIDETFRPEQRFAKVRIEKRNMQYLYSDGDQYHFMDTKTYDQVALAASALGDALKYLKDGSEITVLSYEDQPIGVELPTSVDLEVTTTRPRLQGRHRDRDLEAGDAGDRVDGGGAPVRQPGR